MALVGVKPQFKFTKRAEKSVKKKSLCSHHHNKMQISKLSLTFQSVRTETLFATNQYLKTPTNIQAKMNCWIHIEILQNARKTTEIK